MLSAHVDYEQYIVSDDWQLKRKEAFRILGKACMACGINYGLNVHHETYYRLGHEKISDLKVLCSRCHKNVHFIEESLGKKNNKSRAKNLHDATRTYIKRFVKARKRGYSTMKVFGFEFKAIKFVALPGIKNKKINGQKINQEIEKAPETKLGNFDAFLISLAMQKKVVPKDPVVVD